MKRLVSILLTIALFASMSACSNDPVQNSGDDASADTVSESTEVSQTESQVSSDVVSESSEVSSEIASSEVTSSEVTSSKPSDEIEHNYEKLTSLNGLNIVNFGDSIFGAFRSTSPERKSISDMLAEKTGATCYNTAIAGTTFAYNWFYKDYYSMHSMARYIKNGDFTPMKTAFDENEKETTTSTVVPEVFGILKDIDWEKIDVITIAYGTNDYGSVGVPITGNEDSYKSKYFTEPHEAKGQPDACDESTMIKAVRYTISTIHEAYPNIRIVILTPIRRFDKAVDLKNDLGYTLSDYVNCIKEISEEMGVACLDMYNDCPIQEDTKDKCFTGSDLVHPNLYGRTVMADYIAENLLDALNSYCE